MRWVDDDFEALKQLLTAWKKKSAPRYAELIERVSKPLAAQRPPLTGSSQLKAWLERAASGDPRDVPVLLAELRSGTSKAITQKLKALESWPADPRIRAALLGAVEKPLLPGRAGRGVTLAVLAQLERSTDPLVLSTLVAWRDGEPGYVSARLRGLSAAVLRQFEATATRLEQKKLRAAVLSPAEVKWCDALEAQLAKPVPALVDGAALLRGVYEHPDSDDARSVYADWLSERGEARGEFIALQLQRARTGAAPTPREAQLERTWARAWLGEAQEVILKRDLVYRRGFLAECAVDLKYDEQERFIGDPIFSTVEIFDVRSGHDGIAALALHPTCRAVWGMVGFTGELPELTRPLRLLGLRYFDADASDSLAELAKLQPGLEELRLDAQPRSLTPVCAFARAHPTLQRLVVGDDTFTRADRFKLAKAR